MQRLLFAGLIGAALLAGRPAAAQAQPGPDEVKRIEAELEKARGHIRELEKALDRARTAGQGPERKTPEDERPMAKKKRSFDGGFGGGFIPKEGQFGKKKDGKGPPDEGSPFGKKKDGKGPWGDGPPFAKKKDGKGPWGDGPPWAKKKDGKGPWGDGPPWARKGPGQFPGFGGPPGMRGRPGQGPWARGGDRNRDLEQRLEDIIRQLEQLRRELSRR